MYCLLPVFIVLLLFDFCLIKCLCSIQCFLLDWVLLFDSVLFFSIQIICSVYSSHRQTTDNSPTQWCWVTFCNREQHISDRDWHFIAIGCHLHRYPWTTNTYCSLAIHAETIMVTWSATNRYLLVLQLLPAFYIQDISTPCLQSRYWNGWLINVHAANWHHVKTNRGE
jgi:hypothetical protein